MTEQTGRKCLVVIWPLDCPPDALKRLERHLDDRERERAARFLTPRLRDEYVAAHGRMRELLAAALHAPLASIAIETGEFGKPRLAGTHAGRLAFSLSYARRAERPSAALALAEGVDIGVDVEHPKAIDLSVASMFAEGERREIEQSPEGENVAVFYRIWTVKEALLKARGDGLTTALDSFEVSVIGAQTPRLKSAAGWETLAPHRLVGFEFDGMVGAVAAIGGGAPVTVEVRADDSRRRVEADSDLTAALASLWGGPAKP